MNNIDVKAIIEKNGMNVREVAKELFPDNRHPKLALDRIIKGDSFLDSNQISKLSLLTGTPIEFLFSGSGWKTSSTPGGLIVLTSGEYKVELDLKNKNSKIFKKESLFHEHILHSSSIPLNEYVTQIESLIKNK